MRHHIVHLWRDADYFAYLCKQQPDATHWWDRNRYLVFIACVMDELRYALGRAACDRWGHPVGKVQHEDFVSGTRDERGRLTDIDGGGVDWFCPRCGQGGRSWF